MVPISTVSYGRPWSVGSVLQHRVWGRCCSILYFMPIPESSSTRIYTSDADTALSQRKKKFLCVWSAAVELTTTDCP